MKSDRQTGPLNQSCHAEAMCRSFMASQEACKERCAQQGTEIAPVISALFHSERVLALCEPKPR